MLIENDRAVGVEYQTGGTRRTVWARAEVIVSGGAYGSPQLLLLSGLGPAEHLREMGVTVLRDMPAVGSNLHDHFNTYVGYRCSQPVSAHPVGVDCWPSTARRARLAAAASRLKSASILVVPRTRARRPP